MRYAAPSSRLFASLGGLAFLEAEPPFLSDAKARSTGFLTGRAA